MELIRAHKERKDNMKDITASRRGFISAVMTIVPGVFIINSGDLSAAKKRGKELLNRLEMERLESSMPKREMLILSDTVGDKTTIYREMGDKKIPVCSMNDTGKIVWEACDGTHSFKDICRLIVDRYQVTETMARRDILAFLEGLKKTRVIKL